jgi:hypothetical protein
MERKNIRIRRDEILRIKFLKNEYTRRILRAIFRTRTLPNLIRFYALTQLQKKQLRISR